MRNFGIILLVGVAWASWPTYRGGPQRTGFVPGQGRFASPSPVLLAAWIVHDGVNSIYSAPALADVNADGSEEIFVGSHSSWPTMTLYRYSGGTVSVVWSSSGTDGSVKYVCPALADANGDGVLDAIVPLDDWWYVKGVRVFSGADGSLLWEQIVVDTVTYSSPLVVGDSMVVVGNDKGVVNALRLSDGSVLWTYSTGDTIWSSPALGDMDGDGQNEIALTNETTFFVLEMDGSLAWSAQVGQWLTTPALVDLDGDGDLEAVLYDAGLGQLLALDFGNSTPLWQTPVEPFNIGSYYLPPSPAVADVDVDGVPEAVIGANRTVWCVDATLGATEWSVVATLAEDTIMGAPVLADLDGLVAPGDGGKLEIVITGVSSTNWDGVIYLLQEDGAVSWRFVDATNLQYPVENEASLGDPDGDGELEIVVVDQSCYGVILDDTAQAYGVAEGSSARFDAWFAEGALWLKAPNAGKVELSFYDPAGRLVWKRSVRVSAGLNRVEVPASLGFLKVKAGTWGVVLKTL